MQTKTKQRRVMAPGLQVGLFGVRVGQVPSSGVIHFFGVFHRADKLCPPIQGEHEHDSEKKNELFEKFFSVCYRFRWV